MHHVVQIRDDGTSALPPPDLRVPASDRNGSEPPVWRPPEGSPLEAAILACVQDLVFVVDADRRVIFWNDAACVASGITADRAMGRPIAELVFTELEGENASRDARETLGGGHAWSGIARIRGVDNEMHAARVTLTPTLADARPVTVGIIRDISGLLSAEGAARLADVRLRSFMDQSPFVAFIKDGGGRYVYANQEFVRVNRGLLPDDWLGRTDAQLWPDRTAAYTVVDQAVIESGEPVSVREDGAIGSSGRWWLTTKFPLLDAAGRPGVGCISLDVSDQRELDDRLATLAAAIEQSSEAVVITDPSGSIEYVNPAFARVSGYSEEELLGSNPRLLKSGLQTSAFYDTMWRVLASGRSWSGDLVNRARDGSLFFESASISPVRDSAGRVGHYVGVKRNVSREHELEDQLELKAREHHQILAAIESISGRDTPEETTLAVCLAVAPLPGLALAAVLLFDNDGVAAPLAIATSDGQSHGASRLSVARSLSLRERACQGPWVSSWEADPSHPLEPILLGIGVRALAYAPLQKDGQVFGVMLAGGEPTASLETLTAHLPAIGEYAALTAALIGPQVAARLERSSAYAEIRSVLDGTRFRPVFQPIVDLQSGAIVGFEALTRFSDGRPPDHVFAEAEAVGLGHELELATLEAAFEASGRLPASAWLDLNVSPSLVVAGDALPALLRRWGWKSVLEVTEHTVVGDYAEFRAAMAALGPDVQLAVDDAGAGYASFRHILELRPRYIKLDGSLVAGIDGDPGRLALVAGISFFATGIGAQLIAEGIETPAELATLRDLGVALGQGYLLGRPDDAAKVQTVQAW